MPNPTEMTAHEMTSLKVGDVLTSTDVLASYPDYSILSGARFVVVENDLGNGVDGILSMRLTPADKGLMEAGDLSEWNDVVHVHGPDWNAVGHEPGADAHDRASPGNAWSMHTVQVRVSPDALSTAERVAAVFAYKVASQLDDEEMAEVVRRNADETDPTICHSHDFCDANMPMLESFQEMGLRTPLDAIADPSLGEGPNGLWNEAWAVAKASWLVAPNRLMRDEEDDELNAIPRP